MQQCYLANIRRLQEILDPLATMEACYRLVQSTDTVTVIRYGPDRGACQLSFPVVHRIPYVPEDEGTLVLLVANGKNRKNPAWQGFWAPVEKQLGHAGMYPSA